MNVPLAHVACCCGRLVLFVAGVAVAMQGDICRDGDLPTELYDDTRPSDRIGVLRWNGRMLEWIAAKINREAREIATPPRGPCGMPHHAAGCNCGGEGGER